MVKRQKHACNPHTVYYFLVVQSCGLPNGAQKTIGPLCSYSKLLRNTEDYQNVQLSDASRTISSSVWAFWNCTLTMGDKRKHGVLGSTNKQSNMTPLSPVLSLVSLQVFLFFLSNFLKCSFVSSLCLARFYGDLINYMLLICNFFLSHFLAYMWTHKTTHTHSPFVMLTLSKFVKYLFLNPTTVDFSESSLNL